MRRGAAPAASRGPGAPVAVGGAALPAALSLVAALVACAHLPGHRARGHGGETITFSHAHSPLCVAGGCANYTVTLGPDGQGILSDGDGRAPDRRFRASPAQVAAFGARLRPYRPRGELLLTGSPPCRTFVTDGDRITVAWASADGHPARLVYNTGCDELRRAAMARALAEAPALLPLPVQLPSPAGPAAPR